MSTCERPGPHGPHFFRRGTWPKLQDMESCPGINTETLEPEPDPEYAWTPATVNLTHAADIVVRAYTTGPQGRPSPAYYGARAVWMQLTGLDEAASLVFAHQVKSAHPPVTAAVVPF